MWLDPYLAAYKIHLPTLPYPNNPLPPKECITLGCIFMSQQQRTAQENDRHTLMEHFIHFVPTPNLLPINKYKIQEHILRT